MSTIAPIFVPRAHPSPSEEVQRQVNTLFGRGLVLPFPLDDAYVNGRNVHGLVGRGTSWHAAENTTSAYIANAAGCTALTTRTVTAGDLVAVPFLHDNNHVLSRLGFRVTTGGATSGAVVGIYDCFDDQAGNIYPRRRLYGSSEFTTTANNTTHEAAPNITLTPGRMYWAVYHNKATVPTIQAVAVAGVGTLLGADAAGGGVSHTTSISVARTGGYSSTLPTIFPTGAVQSALAPPSLYVGYAANRSAALSHTMAVLRVAEAGWVLRSAALVAGSTKQSGSLAPSVLITPRIRNASGASQDLGSFDSATTVVAPGSPYAFVSFADVALAVGVSLEVFIEHRGWPLLSVRDCAVTFTLAREKP